MTLVLILVFGVLFGMIGGAAEGDEGFVFGALLGILAGLYTALRVKFGRIERRVKEAEEALNILSAVATPTGSTVSSKPPVAATPETPVPEFASEISPTEAATRTVVNDGPTGPAASTKDSPDPWLDDDRDAFRRPPGAAAADRLFTAVGGFFTTGNIVVKVGLVVLFFGVSFLIKFAHDKAMLPVEFRLAGIAAVGIGLLVVGWKLRGRNPNYAMTLQGGAVGILYLTVFGAARLYHVLPTSIAFALMIGLVLLSGALAVLQNAPTLAAFGSAGGFLAPVLTSTGQGSHVALFSFYALLNLGIFGIAWFKAWRILNWLGFVFTFVIATAWGARYYAPVHFASTEPFLILFTLFYIAITVLFATRQPPRLRRLVDGSLVFGVPAVGFALQSRLVRVIEFGLAYSSLILGAFYVVLAFVLWRRYRDDMRLLAESFLALGVIFASLSIPLALDGHWTAAAWSLEATGIIWIGLRQTRIAARAFGVLLQIGAASLFFLQAEVQTTTPAVFNSAYVGSIMIAAAGLLSAYLYARYRVAVHRYEEPLEIVLLAWGLIWWLGAGINEIVRHLPAADEGAALIAFSAFSALGLSAIARRLDWDSAGRPAMGLLPALALIAGVDFAAHAGDGPFRQPYAIAWTVGLVVNFGLLARFAGNWGERWRGPWHAGSLYLVCFLAAWAATAFVDRSTDLSDAWIFSTAALVPAVLIIALVRSGDRIAWPVARFEDSYRRIGLFPIAVILGLWIIASVTQEGDPTPLSYIPIFNPIDVTGLLILLSLLVWWFDGRTAGTMQKIEPRHIVVMLGLLCFFWFNAILFRTVHHTTGTPYDFSLMWRAPTLQSTISLAWTLLGSAAMALAALKLQMRELWIAGAILLGLVIVKLFTVDLADIGTVARIVSFMGVGLLLLVIGYFAPLPPRTEGKE